MTILARTVCNHALCQKLEVTKQRQTACVCCGEASSLHVQMNSSATIANDVRAIWALLLELESLSHSRWAYVCCADP